MSAGQKLIIGCGYLGRRVAARWIEQGQRVRALTRSRENAAVLHEAGIEPIIGDVTDATSLARLPAAETLLYAVGLDRTARHSMREVYVGGLTNVVERSAAHSGRLIYISSTSVYGQSDGQWIDESSPCEPTSDNGRICLEAEKAVQQIATSATSEPGVCETVILRLSGLYGPGRLLRRIEDLRAGSSLDGSPDTWLNLIHVDDAAAAVLAAEQHASSGATYLISDDRPIRRREYYDRLASLVNAPQPVFAASIPLAASPSLGKRCSNRRARSELLWKPQFASINEGLPAAVPHG